ncbi:hypothetical protein BD410DRAFT_285846 [Rickenella mellea]|uniref:Uncharacterized protein n=1 Tax=Rickenella mellea TaxID=50990 RepID=A0A4Y7Q322_9AGAM|nr:hypothetical protein BD410DRAFT_285846 [Rickenella mellea]
MQSPNANTTELLIEDGFHIHFNRFLVGATMGNAVVRCMDLNYLMPIGRRWQYFRADRRPGGPSDFTDCTLRFRSRRTRYLRCTVLTTCLVHLVATCFNHPF